MYLCSVKNSGGKHIAIPFGFCGNVYTFHSIVKEREETYPESYSISFHSNHYHSYSIVNEK